MSVSDRLTGLLPTVIVAGVATKMTQSLFGKSSNANAKKKARKGYPSTQYRPW